MVSQWHQGTVDYLNYIQGLFYSIYMYIYPQYYMVSQWHQGTVDYLNYIQGPFYSIYMYALGCRSTGPAMVLPLVVFLVQISSHQLRLFLHHWNVTLLLWLNVSNSLFIHLFINSFIYSFIHIQNSVTFDYQAER